MRSAHWYWGREGFRLAVSPVAFLVLLGWDTPAAAARRVWDWNTALSTPYMHSFYSSHNALLGPKEVESMRALVEPPRLDEFAHFEGPLPFLKFKADVETPEGVTWENYLRMLGG